MFGIWGLTFGKFARLEGLDVCCLLFVVCCLLFVVCCLLFVVCCLWFVVCGLWFVVRGLWFVGCVLATFIWRAKRIAR